MTPEPPSLDLLVVGGMAVDHLPDGTSGAGGSVVHIARAAAPRGVRVGIVTASGEEPEAQAGLAELRRLAAVIERQPHAHSVTFRHRESAAGRRLWLQRSGGAVQAELGTVDRIPAAVLFAPILAEIPDNVLSSWGGSSRRAAILQGWLRSTDEGAEVRPLPLSAMRSPVVEALSRFDLLVASREDLLAESDAPDGQLTALRRVFGPTPDLVITDGVEGIWIDAEPALPDPRRRRHLAVPRRLEVASTVGAGDVLAAFMTMPSEDPSRGIDLVAEDAMRVVAEVLEERLG